MRTKVRKSFNYRHLWQKSFVRGMTALMVRDGPGWLPLYLPRQQRDGTALQTGWIDAHVDNLCLGDVQDLVAAFRLDAHLHGDGSSADANQSGLESNHVSHQDGPMKFDFIDGHRY